MTENSKEGFVYPPPRFGRRGMILLILGFVWLILGYAVIGAPRAPGFMWIVHERIPSGIRIAMWWFTGLVAMIFAPMRKPLGRDRWGFTALMIMPLERTISYLLSWVVWWLPTEENIGFSRGWAGAAVYGAFCLMIFTIAGWSETIKKFEGPTVPSKESES